MPGPRSQNRDPGARSAAQIQAVMNQGSHFSCEILVRENPGGAMLCA